MGRRHGIGQRWRDWWDSFCLVTPNWSVQLPGHPYDGSDPDGFMPRDEIVAYLERYAASAAVPLREGVEVRSLESTDHDRFVARTTAGDYRADSVVLANGSYQRPHLPAGADDGADGLDGLGGRRYLRTFVRIAKRCR